MNIHGELYMSEAFLQTHKDLQQSPPELGCDLECVVVALMFWSDATQLTTFSNAKLWPCYMFFGNKSKYRRCKPSCCLCSHIAYFNHICTYSLSFEISLTNSSSLIASRILQLIVLGVRLHLLTSWLTVITSCSTHNGGLSLTMNF